MRLIIAALLCVFVTTAYAAEMTKEEAEKLAQDMQALADKAGLVIDEVKMSPKSSDKSMDKCRFRCSTWPPHCALEC
jgi:predicted lipoprotein with Yx(FWY)xxD motif